MTSSRGLVYYQSYSLWQTMGYLTMLLPCHHTQTELDINWTSNLLRQFNSATDITLNGGKKQERVSLWLKSSQIAEFCIYFRPVTPQLVECTCNNMHCLFQVMHWHTLQFWKMHRLLWQWSKSLRKKVVCVIASKRLMDHILPVSHGLRFFLSMRCPLWLIM